MIWHSAPAAIVPPDNERDVAPIAGGQPEVKVPQPGAVGAVELLTVISAGKISVIETLVSDVSIGAVMLIRSRLLAPAMIVVGEKDFAAVGGMAPAVTVRTGLVVAAVRFVTPWVVVTELTGIVFV